MPNYQGATGEAADGGADGFDRLKNIGPQAMEEVRSVAAALIEEQKQNAAGEVAGVAQLLRNSSQSLDPSSGVASYADRTAGRIEHFARSIRERSLSAIAADAEEFARGQPTLFVLTAIAAGFAAGRLLIASSARRRGMPALSRPDAGERETG